MRYKIALQGFTGRERRELINWLDVPETRAPAYELADSLSAADLVIADGDSEHVIYELERQGRIATTAFVGLLAPSGAVAHLNRPIDRARVLRSLDNLVARTNIEPGAFARASQFAGLLGDELFVPVVAESDARAAAKAAARQAARRARVASTAASSALSSAPPNVLVLDESDTERDRLCRLLEDFGFCTYPVTSIAQATWMSQTRPFAAAFLEIKFDNADVAEAAGLCQLVKRAPATGDACALIIIGGKVGPVDRVRAALVGSDAVLTKPLGRGDVARALEGCQVVLPVDARRH